MELYEPIPPPGVPGPWRWVVTWGALNQPGLQVVEVEAWEQEEAMVRAQELRPDLGRPKVAFIATAANAGPDAPWRKASS